MQEDTCCVFSKRSIFQGSCDWSFKYLLGSASDGNCVLQGTPLQGSLGWGLNVINGSNNTGAEEEDEADIPGSEKEEINTNTQSVTDQSMTESIRILPGA